MSDRCYPHRTRCCRSCEAIAPEVITEAGPFTVISTLPMPVHEPTCVFPDCRYDARPDFETCVLHERVTVTGSWVADRHDEASGGEH